MFSGDLSGEAVKYDERLLLSLEGKEKPAQNIRACEHTSGRRRQRLSVSVATASSNTLMKV